MSTRGYLVIEGEDEGADAAYVFIDGDAYPAQVEGIVTEFLDGHTNGDLAGLSATDKARALVSIVETRRRGEYPVVYSFGDKVTTIEYSPWLTVVSNAKADLDDGAIAFTLTYGYDLFEGRRLKAERTARGRRR